MYTKIAALRKMKKLSQEELAQAVGVTRQTITSVEVGKYVASLPLAYKIASYFGCKIEDVFDFSGIEQELRARLKELERHDALEELEFR